MAKELVDGQEFVDGKPVEVYDGKFTGTFEMDEFDGASMCSDELVTFIVTARVDMPVYGRVRKTGQAKRTNKLKLESAILVDAEKAKYMYDNMNVAVFGVNDGLIESSDDSEDVEFVPAPSNVTEISFQGLTA